MLSFFFLGGKTKSCVTLVELGLLLVGVIVGLWVESLWQLFGVEVSVNADSVFSTEDTLLKWSMNIALLEIGNSPLYWQPLASKSAKLRIK